MAVVKVVNGVVIQTWRDVETVLDAVDKYNLDPSELYVGNYPPGTQYDGTSFYAPTRPPKPKREPDVLLALRELADEMGPRAVAKMNARFGPK